MKLVHQQLTDVLTPARAARRSRPCRASHSTRTYTRALSHRPSEGPRGHIADVWQRGYTLGDARRAGGPCGRVQRARPRPRARPGPGVARPLPDAGGVQERQSRRDQGHTASWPGSTTRTETRATRPPRSGSSRSARPTTWLSDPDGAKQYDTFGQTFRPGQGPPAGGFQGFDFGGAGGAAGFDLGDLLAGGLFGRAAAAPSRRPAQRRGADIEVQVRGVVRRCPGRRDRAGARGQGQRLPDLSWLGRCARARRPASARSARATASPPRARASSRSAAPPAGAAGPAP